jgi:cell division protein FtsN
MVRDYAKKTFSHKRRKIKKSSQHWGLYILLILLLSLFFTGLYYKIQASAHHGQATHLTKSTPLVAPTVTKPPSPVFEFYTLLPKMTASSRNPVSPYGQLPAQTREKSGTNKNYFLQVATLSRQEDADALKAKLLLLGFDVVVKTVIIKNEIGYRVSTGPYLTLAAKQADQDRMRENHIGSF